MRLPLLFFLFILAIYSNAQQLVLPGDHPDPSVVKIGDEYWAAGTTSNWFPAFTLYRSRDLVSWTAAGHVFTKMPGWAGYYMWAPEISYDNGKVYIYYAARKKEGSMCIAAAVAHQPEGPYRDLGPLMCEADGSIDAFPVRDEKGKLHILWKEDGNSAGKPTPIWAAEMKEDRTGLIGRKRELFRADMPWERGLVEGVSVIRHRDYFYAFYAGAACCGRTCSYGTGVARSKSLYGPWEKYPGNPVLIGNSKWKCPGHGTPVEKDGRFYFLYHAYSTGSDVYAGRQGLLNEFEFTADGWLRFLNQPDETEAVMSHTINDHFSADRLAGNWHWSIFREVNCSVAGNTLKLQALPVACGAYIGQSVLTSDYEAQVTLLGKSSSAAGLALIGDDRNMVAATLYNGMLRLTQLKQDKAEVLAEKKINRPVRLVFKVKVVNNTQAFFTYSMDGRKFHTLNNLPADIYYLPPWDRALRVGLVSKGDIGNAAFFKDFVLKNR
ncbi:glycoside hydrolase family 43 protein [Niabella sp. CC-SYL272]|uniref:glycoside hydrolase family 43 protein n=1 Tax=Niabella agricola TaxID=2891571 RepID=UPI001F17FEE0|nr:glycoside hydrolase family 43 protein [Niabella agricola]MCF3109388.1 glycoside hydrolase family 43 protein [Niabella agricola]